MGTMEDGHIVSMIGSVDCLSNVLTDLKNNGLLVWQGIDSNSTMPTNLASGIQTVIDGFMGSVFTAYDALSGCYNGI